MIGGESLPNVIGKRIELPQQRPMVEDSECWTLSSTGTRVLAHTCASHSFATQYRTPWCLTSMTSEPTGLLTVNVCHCKRMAHWMLLAQETTKVQKKKKSDFCLIYLSLSHQIKDQKSRLPKWHLLSPECWDFPVHLAPLPRCLLGNDKLNKC